ncbi:conserved hypothetical protein [Leishmania braziliensis MHOM/BR/75/M2904]|uniref:Transporter n=1 Tax=Leishmania braziliensis TaxID=5660 RepID=A4HMU7_LEIBR|nr:conserved hypothetical protein [Leishmania braziliensis MHOM/BR/75/M2904]CAJ2480399.1 unnamed protein product [Leishmania braziliensis]CAM43488.1 conserved hypothetical protein [Leishmania braziliensis MHOM/BR/75/M2904]
MPAAKNDTAVVPPSVVNGPVRGQHEETHRPKHKATPLPMNQLFPMAFVLLNESICSTMLLPFVGLLVAHLKGVSVNEAGYFSGILIGVFMLGQVVSSRMWGWVSDKYGRRFPLISGLFTSGFMMLGFGLSTSVWMCGIFRFMHGLFNGNVLVAKTMMADITDKTNAAKGFAFVSLCYGIGVLIGPTLGGTLYNPGNSSALRWAHIDKDSVLNRKPALLPSLVIFIYTNIGMMVCTFFVMESNPKAQRLPLVLRFLYPCFLREPRMFANANSLSKEQPETNITATKSESNNDSRIDDENDDRISIHSAELFVRNVVMTRAVASLTVPSAVLCEDPRYDRLVISETLANAIEQASFVEPQYSQSHMTVNRGDTVNESACDMPDRALSSSSVPPDRVAPGDKVKCQQCPLGESRANNGRSDRDGSIIVVEADQEGTAARAISNGAAPVDDKVGQLRQHEDYVELKSFGYKQAFERPVTRTMLLLYMFLSAADMAVQEIVPLWAIAQVEKGGLGFGADKVGYVVFTNSVPCVASNLLFYKACRRYVNKLGLFRMAVMWCSISVTLLPLTSCVNLGGLLFPAVVLCTSVRQFFASWCYGLVTMLTAHSAPPTHVGSIMGINQACGASVRALIPFVVTPLFAWSITSGNSFPLNHVFIFFLSALTFASAYVCSMWLRTNRESVVEIVVHNFKWILAVKDSLRRWNRRLCGASESNS